MFWYHSFYLNFFSADPLPPKNAPPDGGFGWVIVIATFLIYFLLGGWRRSYGVILIEIKEHYQTNTGMAAFIGSASSSGILMFSKSKQKHSRQD